MSRSPVSTASDGGSLKRPRCLPDGAAMLAAIALLLVSFSSVAAEPLRLAVSMSPLSLPFFVAESQGYFADEGLKLQINEVVGGHRSMQQLLDGEADLGTCSEAVVMFNSFKSRDYAVVATFVTSDDDVKVIARGASGVAMVQQLPGKTVGTVLGAASHYYLDTLLLGSGIDPKTVHLRGIAPEAMADALRRGEVDAVAIWEPFAFNILNSVPGARLLPKSGSYVEAFNLIAHRSLLGRRDEELSRLLSALDRAQQFIRTQPARAQAILRHRLQVEPAFIEWIWPRNAYRLTLEQSLLTTLEGEARWARQEGHVHAEKSPNYLDFIYPAPLRKVHPAGVGIN